MAAPGGQPQWGAPPPQGWYPPAYPARPTNTMAILALVSAFLMAPLAIMFGHIALSQIKRTNEEGRGMAIAGLVIGYVFTGIGLLVLVVWVILMIIIIAASNSVEDPSSTYSMAALAVSGLRY